MVSTIDFGSVSIGSNPIARSMDSNILQQEVNNIITETRKSFVCGDDVFFIHQVSLGQALLIANLMKELGVDERASKTSLLKILYDARNVKKFTMCRVIALYTFERREELLNSTVINERARRIMECLDDNKIMSVFMQTINVVPLQEVYKYIGLDKEHRDINKIRRIQEQSQKNSFTFCGRSLAGSLIAPACEKMHMTPRQVVWDISYRFLQLIMADAVATMYLTDEERKKARVTNDRIRINMDSKDAQEYIKSMRWD